MVDSHASKVESEARTFAKHVALDWGIRLGFQSGMLAAIVSVLAVFSDPVDYVRAGIGVTILATIWWSMGFFIWRNPIGELVEDRSWFQPALLCDCVLIVVNILLIWASCSSDKECMTFMSSIFG